MFIGSRVGETNHVSVLHSLLRTNVRGEDEDEVLTVNNLTSVIRYTSVIHNLEEHIVNLRVCLLNLITEKYAILVLLDSLREQTTVVVSYITRTSTDKFGNCCLVRILRHIESHEVLLLSEHFLCDGLRQEGLTTSGTTDCKYGYRLVLVRQPNSVSLDCLAD